MTKPVFDSMIWSSQNTQYSVLLIIGFLHAEKISTEQLNKEQRIIKTEGWILTLRREALPGTSAKILAAWSVMSRNKWKDFCAQKALTALVMPLELYSSCRIHRIAIYLGGKCAISPTGKV